MKHFFNVARKNVQLSPYFVARALCSISLLWDFTYFSAKEPDAESFRLLLAFAAIMPAWQAIVINYEGYKTASMYLQKYGYQQRWAKHFMDSTCERQQIKMACKEQNHLEAYKKHLKDAKVKWYHIEPNRSDCIRVTVTDPLLIGGATVYSHVCRKENVANRNKK